jgi:hypothetical protein
MSMDALWSLLTCIVTATITWLAARGASSREIKLLEIIADSANRALAKQRQEIDAIREYKPSKNQMEALARVRDAINGANGLSAKAPGVPNGALQGGGPAANPGPK